VAPDGGEVEPIDEAAIRKAAREIAAEGIVTVGIVLLHSYANAAHEKRVAEILREEHPSVLLSLSSEVLPVLREYERSVVTLLNAYVMPTVSTYVEKLEQRAEQQGIAAPLLLMKSSGGVASTRAIRRTPVETALSGPAAGIVGAAFVAKAAGFGDLITIDIGGTSADIALIRAGQPGITTNGRIADWRVTLPMVDLTTIGAGGGSLARISETGGLVVGPQSAGAVPGPVCYGRGGTQPTVRMPSAAIWRAMARTAASSIASTSLPSGAIRPVTSQMCSGGTGRGGFCQVKRLARRGMSWRPISST
jgi:N-methylhydantoinase A